LARGGTKLRGGGFDGGWGEEWAFRGLGSDERFKGTPASELNSVSVQIVWHVIVALPYDHDLPNAGVFLQTLDSIWRIPASG